MGVKALAEKAETLEKGKKKESVGEFIQKTREELDRTSFPTSDEVKKTTIIVLINVIFFAIFLFLVDKAWIYVLEGLTWVANKIAGV
jgi:preprotein translocase SecE subunit